MSKRVRPRAFREGRLLRRGRPDLPTKKPTPAKLNEAAAALGRRFVRKYGKAKMVELGAKGGRAAWEGWTAEEIRNEMSRRRALARSRRMEENLEALAAVKKVS